MENDSAGSLRMFSRSGVIVITILSILAGVLFILRSSQPVENMWRSGGKHWINHMDEFQKQIEQNPQKAAGPMNGLANAYMDQGKIDLAIETYTKAMALDPMFPSPYNGRALAYQDKGQYGKAMEDLNKAVELNPTYAFAYINKGRNYMSLGQYDKALENFTKAIELNPHYPDTYYNRAVTYSILGDLENAQRDYRKVIEIAPNEVNTVKAYEALSVINNDLGNAQEAIADLDRANLLKLKIKIHKHLK